MIRLHTILLKKGTKIEGKGKTNITENTVKTFKETYICTWQKYVENISNPLGVRTDNNDDNNDPVVII